MEIKKTGRKTLNEHHSDDSLLHGGLSGGTIFNDIHLNEYGQ